MKDKRKRIWIDRFQTYLALRFVCYFVLYLLWRYVFSAKARDKRGEPPEY